MEALREGRFRALTQSLAAASSPGLAGAPQEHAVLVLHGTGRKEGVLGMAGPFGAAKPFVSCQTAAGTGPCPCGTQIGRAHV